MKTAKVWVVAACLVALFGVIANWILTRPESQPPRVANPTPPGASAEPSAAKEPLPSTPVAPGEVAEETAPPPAETALARDETLPKGPAPKVQPASPPVTKKAKEPLKDPLARVALAMVGTDPDAEAYWCEAINDPGLSAHERSDLIEDLNEDGLSDPKHPTLADLPLIFNRLALIEDLAPAAMDQVNLDAFAEAYKDLLNLADITLGGGRPVK